MTNYSRFEYNDFYENIPIDLKGWSKTCLLLLAISIDFDHMVFFFFSLMHADALTELVLKRMEDIVKMYFSTQYAIYIFYIRSIFAWLSLCLDPLLKSDFMDFYA